MLRRLRYLAVVIVLVTCAACTGSTDSGGSAAPGSGSKKGTPTGKRHNKGPGCQYIVAGDAKRSTPVGTNLEYLVDAVAAPTTCYDAITFTFDPGDGPDLPPAYTVEYRTKPFGLEGIPTSTAGFKQARAVLYVELTPTSTTNALNPARPVETYKGNLRLQLKGLRHTVIVEYVSKLVDATPDVHTDDKLVWLIGLNSKQPFTVDAANQPPRVTVIVMR
jgi:hypothetical protein